MSTQEELEVLQIQLEQETTDIGVKKYRDALAKAQEHGIETTVDPQNKLMLSAIPPVSAAIKSFLKDALKPGAGRRKTAIQHLVGVDSDAVAFIVAHNVINGISKALTTLQLEIRIASAIGDYLMLEKFKETNKGLYDFALKNTEESGNTRYKRNSMRHYAKWSGVESHKKRSILLGVFLLETFIQHTGLVEKKNFVAKGKTRQIIQATPETMEWLQEKHSQSESMSPFWLPMIVKPTQWTTPRDGGYRSIEIPIMKIANKNYLEELTHMELGGVYRSVNALQETPWRVNQTILQVVTHLWETGADVPVLPPRDRLETPKKPCEDDEIEIFKVTNKDEWVKWRRDATMVHTQNNRMDSKRIALAQRLWMANKFKDFDELFFPHTMDWRGRVYPVVPLLNPQSDDLGKSLLEFSVGAELGEHGAKWLKIHLANNFGVDKVSLEDRIHWTEEHETIIRMVALDPYTYKFWMEADSPWQFLAACFEWERYKHSGEGEKFISNLSVNQDGTCNGLQNFSALLRDPVGGKATNLMPADVPADIYVEVANVVQDKVTKDLSDPTKALLAQMWDNKVSRKIVKRQVMTLPYGSTEYGMRDQLKDVLKGMRDDGINLLNTNDQALEWQAIGYITGHIWTSIGEVVVAARQAMDWLKQVAQVSASNGLPLQWTAPSGLPILQNYKKVKQKVINTGFGKVRLVRKYNEDTNQVDVRRQSNGLSPNLVHSFDAAHMMATINLCLEQGIVDFCMVHDSYGTHAGHMEILNVALREAFRDQYKENVLARLHSELETQTGLELPKPPAMGDLDLNLITESKYFFA